jgi:hypothetical protein
MENAEPDILPALLRTTPAAVRHAESAIWRFPKDGSARRLLTIRDSYALGFMAVGGLVVSIVVSSSEFTGVRRGPPER